MRLLHARDLTFKEFIGSSVPQYAIVSHRWGNKEPSYQDFHKYKEQYRSRRLRRGSGWTKIRKAAELALRCDIEWLWIDTVCINKESSAELTEAINSMYAWYSTAMVCFVFLPDVHNIESCTCELSDSTIFRSEAQRLTYQDDRGTVRRMSAFFRTPSPVHEHEFRGSCWFERSWTLQELLAPEYLVFFNSNFEDIGTGFTLARLIQNATGIPGKYFTYHGYMPRPWARSECVAERMRWASRRNATRIEDEAYSLLGLFNVNMPLLYGEGKRAFRRLQIEILKDSRDETILAWNPANAVTDTALAASARYFSISTATENIERTTWIPRKHYEYTNMGLRFNVSIHRARRRNSASSEPDYQWSLKEGPALLFPLNCDRQHRTESGDIISEPVALLLQMMASEADLELKSVRALRGGDDMCSFKQNTRGEANDDDDMIPDPRGRASVPVLYGKWVTMEKGERAVFNLMVGRMVAGTPDDYSLYIHT